MSWLIDKWLGRRATPPAAALLLGRSETGQHADRQAELGNILALQQRYADAENAYRLCLLADATHSSGRIGLARVLAQTGRPTEALLTLAQISPDSMGYFDAALVASEVHRSLDRMDQAILALERCTTKPDCPEIVALELIRCHQLAGHPEPAIEFAQHWLSNAPASRQVEHFLGTLLATIGRWGDAEAVFVHLLRAHPDHAVALNELGDVQRRLGRFDEALENFQLAVHHDPASTNARVNLITELDRAGHASDARRESAALLKQAPENAGAWFWEGKLADQENEIERAAGAYAKAAAISPGTASIWTNLGLVRLRQGNNHDAIACQRRALTIAPLDAAVHLNLGFALQSAGDLNGALGSYAQSRKLDPSDGLTLLHEAIAQLTAGDFAHGWDGYEKRWLRETALTRQPGAPLWNGAPLSGKRLLIWGEQGLGDQIMFASCIAELASAASECVIECAPRLAVLFQRSFPTCRVVAGASQQDLDKLCAACRFDVQSPMGSLPRHTRRASDQFPQHHGYLIPKLESQLAWRTRLAKLPGKLKVGVSWIGGAPITRKHLRSHTLASWLPLLGLTEIDFISLQYTDCHEELAAVQQAAGIKIWHWRDAIDDFDQTAALVSQLDLVISVCTTVVHLAGALNVPAWVMTPATPEWRYLNQGTHMPWYGSVLLFRQTKPNDWTEVIHTIQIRLAGEVAQRM